MILVDTSIWIDHLRKPLPELARVLNEQSVVQHPHVTTELALGSLANRSRILALLAFLPQASSASDDRLLAFIDDRQLMGTGIRYVDCQLLASCCSDQHLLWTRDKRLMSQAEQLGCAYRSAN